MIQLVQLILSVLLGFAPHVSDAGEPADERKDLLHETLIALQDRARETGIRVHYEHAARFEAALLSKFPQTMDRWASIGRKKT